MTSKDDDSDDDPIKLVDFEQVRFDLITADHDKFSHVDVCDLTDSDIEEITYVCSQENPRAKVNATLPVKSFDLFRHVELINECKALTIRVVDCVKHSWYYKKYKRTDLVEDSESEEVNVVDEETVDNKEQTNIIENKPAEQKTGVDNSRVSSELSNSNMLCKKVVKPKIRPVDVAAYIGQNISNKAKPWQKPNKKKDKPKCHRKSVTVDFRRNKGLVGLKIIQRLSDSTQTTDKFHIEKTTKTSSEIENGPQNKPQENIPEALNGILKNTTPMKSLIVDTKQKSSENMHNRNLCNKDVIIPRHTFDKTVMNSTNNNLFGEQINVLNEANTKCDPFKGTDLLQNKEDKKLSKKTIGNLGNLTKSVTKVPFKDKQGLSNSKATNSIVQKQDYHCKTDERTSDLSKSKMLIIQGKSPSMPDISEAVPIASQCAGNDNNKNIIDDIRQSVDTKLNVVNKPFPNLYGIKVKTNSDEKIKSNVDGYYSFYTHRSKNINNKSNLEKVLKAQKNANGQKLQENRKKPMNYKFNPGLLHTSVPEQTSSNAQYGKNTNVLLPVPVKSTCLMANSSTILKPQKNHKKDLNGLSKNGIPAQKSANSQQYPKILRDKKMPGLCDIQPSNSVITNTPITPNNYQHLQNKSTLRACIAPPNKSSTTSSDTIVDQMNMKDPVMTTLVKHNIQQNTNAPNNIAYHKLPIQTIGNNIRHSYVVSKHNNNLTATNCNIPVKKKTTFVISNQQGLIGENNIMVNCESTVKPIMDNINSDNSVFNQINDKWDEDYNVSVMAHTGSVLHNSQQKLQQNCSVNPRPPIKAFTNNASLASAVVKQVNENAITNKDNSDASKTYASLIHGSQEIDQQHNKTANSEFPVYTAHNTELRNAGNSQMITLDNNFAAGPHSYITTNNIRQLVYQQNNPVNYGVPVTLFPNTQEMLNQQNHYVTNPGSSQNISDNMNPTSAVATQNNVDTRNNSNGLPSLPQNMNYIGANCQDLSFSQQNINDTMQIEPNKKNAMIYNNNVPQINTIQRRNTIDDLQSTNSNLTSASQNNQIQNEMPYQLNDNQNQGYPIQTHISPRSQSAKPILSNQSVPKEPDPLNQFGRSIPQMMPTHLHCAPMYNNTPQYMNMTANSMYYYNLSNNCSTNPFWHSLYHTSFPPPPSLPQSPTISNVPSKSVAGSIIGRNDSGEVRKIQIPAVPKTSPIFKLKKDNKNDKTKHNSPVNSKKEMLEELTKVTIVSLAKSSSKPNVLKKSVLEKKAHAKANKSYIHRPRPGPLSKKFKIDAILEAHSRVEPHLNTSPSASQGYSPPVLPIPTFTETFEVLAKNNYIDTTQMVHNSESFNPPQNYHQRTSTGSSKDTQNYKEIPIRSRNAVGYRKRKLFAYENNQDLSTKKISLDEYKKRTTKGDDDKSRDQVKIKAACKSLSNNCLNSKEIGSNPEQDLGYDSDSTLKM